ncbi:MAG: O-methyltransferase [Gemmatimonadales bacterium]
MSRDEDKEQWTEVDHYLAGLLLPDDPVLRQAVAASDAAGLPAIQISPLQGQWLAILAAAIRAKSILEIGTLGGYSTIWLARALAPGGRLISLELDPAHAAVARANLAHAGVADRATVRVGPAQESLRAIAAEGLGPFDLIFIDADKTGYPAYWTAALALARRGSLIIADNVVRDGAIADAGSQDENVIAVRRLNDLMAADPHVSVTVLQTVGVKGYDGFAVALVTGSP